MTQSDDLWTIPFEGLKEVFGLKWANASAPAQEPWPEMSPDAFYGLAGDVVRAIDPHSEADPVAILLQFLAAFGNAVGIDPYFEVDGAKHRAKLFVVLCGITSKARKGTSLGRIRQLMRDVDSSWERDNIQSGLSSGEGLIYHVRDAVSKAGKDGAVEVDVGVIDKRVMLIVEEFASTLAVMSRPGNTLSPVLRDAWGTAKLQTMTKNQPLKATDSHISLIGHVTKDELRAALNHTEMANGFANRFLFARVRRSKLLPFGGHLDAEALHTLALQVTARLASAHRIVRVTMTDCAAKMWEKNYASLSREQPGLLGSILGRAEAQVTRLALLFALTDGQAQIDQSHLSAAMAVWFFCEESASQIWGDMLGNDVADAILGALEDAGAEGMSRSEMLALFSRHKKAAHISAGIQLLEQLGKAEPTKSAGHGERRWRVRKAPPGEEFAKNRGVDAGGRP
jgi:hypothetical protein